MSATGPERPEQHSFSAPAAYAPHESPYVPTPQPQQPVQYTQDFHPAELKKRRTHLRDAWLLVGVGVLIPMLALAGAIWAVVQASSGQSRAIAPAVVGFAVFALRSALYVL
jgi:hypothetical protein